MAEAGEREVWVHIRNHPTVSPLLRGLYARVLRVEPETSRSRIHPLTWCVMTNSWVPSEWLEPLTPDAEARMHYVAAHYRELVEWEEPIADLRKAWREWLKHLLLIGHDDAPVTWFAKDLRDALGHFAVLGGGAEPGTYHYTHAVTLWNQLEAAARSLAARLEQEVGV